MVLRDNVSVREAARRLRISRNTAKRVAAQRLIDAYAENLQLWIKADSHRGKRERRTVKAYYEAIRAMGYSGGPTQVHLYCRAFKQALDNAPRQAGFIPLSFELGEAFQFDWSCECVVIAGLRRRLEVAHTKLAASRAYVLAAYFTQSHEMLFDAHTRAFAVLGGVPPGAASTTTCAPPWTRWVSAPQRTDQYLRSTGDVPPRHLCGAHQCRAH